FDSGTSYHGTVTGGYRARDTRKAAGRGGRTNSPIPQQNTLERSVPKPSAFPFRIDDIPRGYQAEVPTSVPQPTVNLRSRLAEPFVEAAGPEQLRTRYITDES